MSTIKDDVEQIYKKLRMLPGFIERPQQQDCSEQIAQVTIDNGILVAEAPTGTGKTLAYLAGGLVTRKHKTIPIVVSTGTKALQDQVFSKDIPKLIKVGVLDKSEVALAKGKRNYICIRNAIDFMQDIEEANQDSDKFLPDALNDVPLDELEDLIQAFEGHKWDGDFDSYKGRLSFKSSVVGVDSTNCTGGKCDKYGICAYYKKRRELATKTVIVTNHNYLLEDLKLSYTDPSVVEGGTSVLPFEQYTLIVDEGHHLPEKAIEVGASVANSSKLRTAFLKWNGMHAQLEKLKQVLSKAVTLGYENDPKLRIDLINVIMDMEDYVDQLNIDEAKGYFRFKKGILPKEIQSWLATLQPGLATLIRSAQALTAACKTIEEPTQAEKELSARAGEVLSDIQDFDRCVKRLLGKSDYAKWVQKRLEDSFFELHACPLEGAVVLKPLLWQSERIKGCVIVSATLRDLKGFDRYTQKTGLPPSTKYMVLDPLFDYTKSKLVVPAMTYSPKQSERKKYIEELKEKLPMYIDHKIGTLILFQSWSVLREFSPLLKIWLGNKLKLQGELPVKMLIEQHCQDIDAKKGSVLVGVATMSEGLDLPGKYCEHVIITALPFVSPADPVEEEISDLLGTEYFSKKSLPDATIKLVQMTGRLIRTDTDSGTITIFDRRVVSERYGRQMIARLPKYVQVIEK